MSNIRKTIALIMLMVVINLSVILPPGLGKSGIDVFLSPPQTLLADNKFGLQYFPDGTVGIISSVPTFKLLIASGVSSFLVEGTDPAHLTKATFAFGPGSSRDYDNGYAGAAGVYQHPDGKLYAFYHAEDWAGMPMIGGGIHGFYCSVAVAISDNNGKVWRKLGRVITSSKAKTWSYYNGQADKGAGEPGIVISKDGDYLYCYYTEHSRQNGRGVQICMARARISDSAPLPGAWLKYYGGGS